MDEADAVLELRLLVLLGSRERPLEIVEDGQELGDSRAFASATCSSRSRAARFL